MASSYFSSFPLVCMHLRSPFPSSIWFSSQPWDSLLRSSCPTPAPLVSTSNHTHIRSLLCSCLTSPWPQAHTQQVSVPPGQEGCCQGCTAVHSPSLLLLPPFLPSTSPWGRGSFGQAAWYSTASACVRRGNYSRTSSKTHTQQQPENGLVPICSLYSTSQLFVHV